MPACPPRESGYRGNSGAAAHNLDKPHGGRLTGRTGHRGRPGLSPRTPTDPNHAPGYPVLVNESHQVPATVISEHEVNHRCPPPVLVAVWEELLPHSAGGSGMRVDRMGRANIHRRTAGAPYAHRSMALSAGRGYIPSRSLSCLHDRMARACGRNAMSTVFLVTPNSWAT